jgi:hypothetical protein
MSRGEIMSIVNLAAFGNSIATETVKETQQHAEITHVSETQLDSSHAKVKIAKVAEFFGTKELCVLAELVDGKIAPQMKALVNQKNVHVVELEHKYGKRPISRAGAKITLMLNGVSKDDLKKNDTIEFWTPIVKPTAKRKGKLIIC